MSYRLTVRDQFSAAHALRNYRGKCENLHGHNFEAAVCVCGDELDPATGMLLDFGVLKRALKTVLTGLDHRDLNALPAFVAENPSSENLARYIFTRMEQELAKCSDPQAARVKLASASVSEKSAQTATWEAD